MLFGHFGNERERINGSDLILHVGTNVESHDTDQFVSVFFHWPGVFSARRNPPLTFYRRPHGLLYLSSSQYIMFRPQRLGEDRNSPGDGLVICRVKYFESFLPSACSFCTDALEFSFTNLFSLFDS